jgi:hypothetical protein
MNLNTFKHGSKVGRHRFIDFIGAKYQLQIITTQPIPGTFVSQKCAKKGCNNLIGSWSKTGQQKPEYKGAKCSKHGGKV